jgi:hypothetical protein
VAGVRPEEKVLRRTYVDDAVYRDFESLAHDLDSIRSLATEGLSREVADLAVRQQEAEGEAASRESRLPEVEADYLRGAIEPEDSGRLRVRLEEERDGARAQAEQCERQRGLIEDRMASFDAETAVVEGLARARRQAVGEIRQAQGEGASTSSGPRSADCSPASSLHRRWRGSGQVCCVARGGSGRSATSVAPSASTMATT